MTSLKALTIRQPWAWLILHGGKDVENRTWPPAEYGPLLIHAGKSWAQGMIGSCQQSNKPGSFLLGGEEHSYPLGLVRGAVVGIVRVWACEQASVSPWAESGMWHWHLCDPLAFSEPVFWRGRQRLFDVPVDDLPVLMQRELGDWLGDLPEIAREEFDGWLRERGDEHE